MSTQYLTENRLVRCGCGRVTNVNMMLDVRALPPAVRGNREYICDGCRERWIREGRISREALYRAIGAPAEAIARVRALEPR